MFQWDLLHESICAQPQLWRRQKPWRISFTDVPTTPPKTGTPLQDVHLQSPVLTYIPVTAFLSWFSHPFTLSTPNHFHLSFSTALILTSFYNTADQAVRSAQHVSAQEERLPHIQAHLLSVLNKLCPLLKYLGALTFFDTLQLLAHEKDVLFD